MDVPRSKTTFHQTTVELARQQSHSRSLTTNLAGSKRVRSEEASVPPRSAPSNYEPFARASAWVGERQPLTPSAILDLGGPPDRGPSEYSQRKAISATPSSTVDPTLSLSHRVYGLPDELIANFLRLGIKQIYPWQRNCLRGPGLLQGEKNLVYSAPTGGGKSLVADVLMLKQVLAQKGAKALLVLPYVALVQEKVRWVRNIVDGVPRQSHASPDAAAGRWRARADDNVIRVAGFYGGSKLRSTWADFDIAVCTIEKANSLVNSAIQEGGIGHLKAVVLDELHMIDDDHRGYLLELLSAKLLSMGHPVQIIGMSATISNIHLLSEWLDGHAYVTNYRPVPIEEHLVYEGYIYPAASASLLVKTASQITSTASSTRPAAMPLRAIHPSQHKEFKEPVLNAVVALASETAMAGYGALVFAGSRQSCETIARLISRVMPSFDSVDISVVDKRLEVLSELRSLNTALDPVLAATIPFGVAFHHAGLTTEEREIVAKAYDSGALKVCVATCSLAAGINLPARRVILHGARMGREFVGPAMLRQMRGRAGRKGKDEVGETYLCCRKSDLETVVDLLEADLPAISSCLDTDKRRMKRALLEVIAIRLATNRPSIDECAAKSLFRHSKGLEETKRCVESSLEQLQSLGFITFDADEDDYEVTSLGKAVVASSIDPDDGLFIYNELKEALKAFVMDGDMHVLYTFTPLQGTDTDILVNWNVYLEEVEALDDSGQRVMQLLGLRIATIIRLSQGAKLPEDTQAERDVARRYRRFFLALQLRDICNEKPIHSVARDFGMPRGAVQVLAQSAQGFAAGMIKFCEVMGWAPLAAALDHFSDRLKAGAKADLLSLAKITFVKSRTARVFWDNGFQSAAAVANADPRELVPILMQAQPNKIRLKEQDDEKYDEKLLVKAQVIVDSASRIWNLEMQEDLEEEE